MEDLVAAELPVRQRAMRGLAALVDESFGVDAANLAELLRSRGGIHTLVRLLDDESAGVHHRAMMVLGNLVGTLVEQPSARLLKHIVRCYLRLSDNPRAREALRQCLPEPLRDATFSGCLKDDVTTKRWLTQLLFNISESAQLVQ